MLLSIFNSSVDHSTRGWGLSWTIGLAGFLIFLFTLEYSMRSDGWEPSLSDSPLLWSKHRQRGSELGDKAFIIVGASRSQLGLDLDIIRQHTGLEPVQLSIDGSSFVPVLRDLAEDERINGKVLVSFSAVNLSDDGESERSEEWISYYHEQFLQADYEPYRWLDEHIGDWLTSQLSSRLTGARPLTVLLAWLNQQQKAAGNYLMLQPDRSRIGDYSKVKMPDFYLQRVARSLGRNYLTDSQTLNHEQLLALYEGIVSRLSIASTAKVAVMTKKIRRYTRQIEQRGGEVTFIRMPIGKLVGRILETRYPRQHFWDPVVAGQQRVIHFRDHAQLSDIELPDGSHPDIMDRQRITRGLLEIMQQQQRP